MKVAERQSTGRPSPLPADPLRSRYADVRGTPVRRAGSLRRPCQDHLQVQKIITVLPGSCSTVVLQRQFAFVDGGLERWLFANFRSGVQ